VFSNVLSKSTSHIPFSVRVRAISRHFYQKLTANTVGRVFISPTGKGLRQWVAQLGTAVRQPEVRVAFIAHVYYLEIVQEILEMRAVLPGVVPLHLTVPLDRAAQLEELVAGIPAITLHPSENRGRDIAPFLSVLGSGALDQYDAVLKLHTKRSPHLLDGEIRRKLLFAMLCGERNAAFRALSAFEDPSTGMVGWRDCYRTASPYWMANEKTVREVSARMEASEAVRLGFFEGSMFWFRPSAFAALRELDLKPEDFEPEERQLDGTLHHSVERCFTIAVWARGFVVRDLRGRTLS
jgi:rhamnosyltransferase